MGAGDRRPQVTQSVQLRTDDAAVGGVAPAVAPRHPVPDSRYRGDRRAQNAAGSSCGSSARNAGHDPSGRWLSLSVTTFPTDPVDCAGTESCGTMGRMVEGHSPDREFVRSHRVWRRDDGLDIGGSV